MGIPVGELVVGEVYYHVLTNVELQTVVSTWRYARVKLLKPCRMLSTSGTMKRPDA